MTQSSLDSIAILPPKFHVSILDSCPRPAVPAPWPLNPALVSRPPNWHCLPLSGTLTDHSRREGAADGPCRPGYVASRAAVSAALAGGCEWQVALPSALLKVSTGKGLRAVAIRTHGAACQAYGRNWIDEPRLANRWRQGAGRGGKLIVAPVGCGGALIHRRTRP